jgi:predicted PurR-regulated permease PerM
VGRNHGQRVLPVPRVLQDLTDWVWRLLLLALAAYLLVRFLDTMYFVVLPGMGALLAAALCYPLVMFLRRRGAPRALATWAAMLAVALLLAAVMFVVVDRASAESPQLIDQISRFVSQTRTWVVSHLHLRASLFDSTGSTITSYLSAHRSSVASGVLTGMTTVSEGLAALVLWFFMTFFFLYDGENIWAWLVGLFPPSARHRVHGAGVQAWDRIAGFVRGTFVIAIFHAVVIAVALLALGVPLVAPLALLVFIGAFLPIVGAVVFGGLAVIVAVVTKGVLVGGIVLAVLVVDHQVEAHLLQPLLVGRYVQLHPLAVAVAISGGTVLEGIYGAILAVPVLAALWAAIRHLATGAADSPYPADVAPAGVAHPEAVESRLE